MLWLDSWFDVVLAAYSWLHSRAFNAANTRPVILIQGQMTRGTHLNWHPTNLVAYSVRTFGSRRISNVQHFPLHVRLFLADFGAMFASHWFQIRHPLLRTELMSSPINLETDAFPTMTQRHPKKWTVYLSWHPSQSAYTGQDGLTRRIWLAGLSD